MWVIIVPLVHCYIATFSLRVSFWPLVVIGVPSNLGGYYVTSFFLCYYLECKGFMLGLGILNIKNTCLN